MENNKELFDKISNEIKKYDNNEFKFMFFVVDTKGNPNSTLTYIYEMALVLKNMGYKVEMLHSEKEFVGVESWMGEEYSTLPHFNIETDKINISPSDFLFIPEVYTSVMFETMKLPCKRIALLTNLDYMTDVIQPGASWEKYGIRDCITRTSLLKDRLSEIFPNIRTNVIEPFISNIFRTNTPLKKPIVNIVSKDSNDVNTIAKLFFLKHPLYKWVGFRHVKGLSREDFSEMLDEAFATIWIDEHSDFGYSPLEAMANGSIVLAKIPNENLEWMTKPDGNMRNNVMWFTNTRDCHSMLAAAIQTYLEDNIPSELYNEMKETVDLYTEDRFIENIKKVIINGYVCGRRKEMQDALTLINKQK